MFAFKNETYKVYPNIIFSPQISLAFPLEY